MGSYPTAYRKGSERYAAPEPAARRLSGFQDQSRRLLNAANDQLPFPANDDFDFLTSEERSKFARRRLQAQLAGEAIAERAALRAAGRLVPLAGEFLLAYDVGKYIGETVARVFNAGTFKTINIPREGITPQDVNFIQHWPFPNPPYQYEGSDTWIGAEYVEDRINAPEGYTDYFDHKAGEPFDWRMLEPGQSVNQTWTKEIPQPWTGEVLRMWTNTGYILRPADNTSPGYDSITVRQPRLVRVLEPLTVEDVQRLRKQQQDNRLSREPEWEAAADPRLSVRPNVIAVASSGLAPGHHVSRPPRKGEKERKLTARSFRAFKMIEAALGLGTESVDFIKAVWDALPPQYKSGYYKLHRRNKKTGRVEEFYVKRKTPPPQTMLKEVWKHLEHLDREQAVENLVANQLEDFAIGKLSSKTAKSVSNSGVLGTRPVGFQTGPAL